MQTNPGGVRRCLTNVEECDTIWLAHTLRVHGFLQHGHVVCVERSVVSSTTATIARLTVRYSADARGNLPTRLFLKISDPGSVPDLPAGVILGDARFYLALRDIECELPVPTCYDAALDEATRRCHLLLEDLSATHRPVQPGPDADAGDCRRMVECLADFHAYWWANPRLKTDFGGLPGRDSHLKYARSIQQELPEFLTALGDDLPRDDRRLYERVADGFSPAFGSLLRPEHLTLINGDAHPRNILLPYAAAEAGCIIDWQFHHVGVCTQDLRHTIGLAWPTQWRRSMEQHLVRHYHQRLVAQGVDYSWDDCWRGDQIGVLDNLFMPMWHQSLQFERSSWLPEVRRAVAAVVDLGCERLLQ
ncbi:MAG: phosphotransferase [Phycisphaerae bacterium]|nr:phosphotransferase [Phycisphaerae bacterium]